MLDRQTNMHRQGAQSASDTEIFTRHESNVRS
jgi:hypothetical protein